jgi:RNA polymerase sigma factor (sigma-70 family)
MDVRDRLLRIARRIVGGESDAEDVVQDAWLRWHLTDRSAVRNVPGFLCRTTARLSINAIQTAHVRHQSSAGRWPVDRPDLADDPAVLSARTDDLRAAVRLLVERLTPRERSAYVLREAFGYPHREIGDVLGLTEANARQLIRRARVRIRVEHGRTASPVDQLRLLGAFLEVARTGDPGALGELAGSAPHESLV